MKKFFLNDGLFVKRKLCISFLMIFALSMLVLSGCSNSSSQGTTTDTTAEQDEAPTIEIVQQQYQVYESSTSGFDVALCCEFKNNSDEMLKIKTVDFTVYDTSKTSLGSDDHGKFGPNVLNPGETGYAVLASGGSYLTINSLDAVASMKVEIDTEVVKEADRNLTVTPEGIIDHTDNIAHKAVNCLVENNNSSEAHDYEIVVGLYDSNGELMGALSNSDTTPIKSDEKAQIQAGEGWGAVIDWTMISTMKGTGRVLSFEDEILNID